jgi:hypothetical protein
MVSTTAPEETRKPCSQTFHYRPTEEVGARSARQAVSVDDIWGPDSVRGAWLSGVDAPELDTRQHRLEQVRRVYGTVQPPGAGCGGSQAVS